VLEGHVRGVLALPKFCYRFPCSECGARVEIDEYQPDLRVDCPQCGATVLVPPPKSSARLAPNEPDMERIHCPSCGVALKVASQSRSSALECPSCHSRINRPSSSSPEEPASQPPGQSDWRPEGATAEAASEWIPNAALIAGILSTFTFEFFIAPIVAIVLGLLGATAEHATGSQKIRSWIGFGLGITFLMVALVVIMSM